MSFFEYKVVEKEGDSEPQIRMFADGSGPPCTGWVGESGWIVGWVVELGNTDPLIQLVSRPLSASSVKKMADAAINYAKEKQDEGQ